MLIFSLVYLYALLLLFGTWLDAKLYFVGAYCVQ